MRSPGINGEGELRGQPANPGSPRKMAAKTKYVKWSVCWSSRQNILVYHTLKCTNTIKFTICSKIFFSYASPQSNIDRLTVSC